MEGEFEGVAFFWDIEEGDGHGVFWRGIGRDLDDVGYFANFLGFEGIVKVFTDNGMGVEFDIIGGRGVILLGVGIFFGFGDGFNFLPEVGVNGRGCRDYFAIDGYGLVLELEDIAGFSDDAFNEVFGFFKGIGESEDSEGEEVGEFDDPTWGGVFGVMEDDDIARFRGGEGGEFNTEDGDSDAEEEFINEEVIAFDESGDHTSGGDFIGFDEKHSDKKSDEHGGDEDSEIFFNFSFEGFRGLIFRIWI